LYSGLKPEERLATNQPEGSFPLESVAVRVIGGGSGDEGNLFIQGREDSHRNINNNNKHKTLF
jgi:hypothetical protein